MTMEHAPQAISAQVGVPLCITGMHRSGTSMVARVLRDCGIYLGPDEDLLPAAPGNIDGFWENVRFVRLNDAILNELGGGWDSPPTAEACTIEPATLLRFRAEAELLISAFSDKAPWAWKDPRNCLTLPFWMDVLGRVKVLHCVRNPLEVAISLRQRSSLSYALSLSLWETYNQRLTSAAPAEDRVVTHYDAWLEDPAAELNRVLLSLGIDASPEIVERASRLPSPERRHHHLKTADLLRVTVSPRIVDLYLRLCDEAGRTQPLCPNVISNAAALSSTPPDRDAALANPASAVEQTAASGSNGSHRDRTRCMSSDLAKPTAPSKMIDLALLDAELDRHALKALREALEVRDARIRELQGALDAQAAEIDRAGGPRSKRDGEIHAKIDNLRDTLLKAIRDAAPPRPKTIPYRELVQRVRDTVSSVVPAGSTVVVVNKGDETLLRIDGCRAWHFPQDQHGVYAGHHPADSAAAISQLEALRAKGAQFVAFPSTAFWWLEHYDGLRRHLHERCVTVAEAEHCKVFQLWRPTVLERGYRWLSRWRWRAIDRSAPRAPVREDAGSASPEDGGPGSAFASSARDAQSRCMSDESDFAVPTLTSAAPPLKPHRASIDIIICIHNALDDVRCCLDSVVRHTMPPFNLILVDDGSDTPTAQAVNEFAKSQPVMLLRNEPAQGYTLAANRGLRASTSPYVVLLNSDTVVTPGWLDRLVACGESDARIGMVGPLSNAATWQSIPHVFEDGAWAENALPEGTTPTDIARLIDYATRRLYPRIPFLNGFCLAIKRRVIDQVGHFDEATFGRGYGEENDYCLRARSAGWELAVADDAYVYHRLSRSYSSERRRQLSELAHAALVEKHGSAVVSAGTEICRADRVLEGIRARSKVMRAREDLIAQGRRRWEGRRVVFTLPVYGPGGGANIVLHEAAAMRKMGVDAWVLNLTRHREAFEHSYRDNTIPTAYVDAPAEVPAFVSDFDAVLATWCESVHWLDFPEDVPRRPIRAYYIQDFEPYFFDTETDGFTMALQSYTLYPDLVRVAKTEWDRRTVRDQTGADSAVGGATVDIDLYGPRRRRDGDWPQRPLRVLAMVRPSTPRRAPKLTMDVLRALKLAHGDRVEVILFGCASDDPAFRALPHDFGWRNAGVLTRAQVASLMNEVDIFADFSSFQAQGLTAMEAMACGVAVIVPENGGCREFVRHEQNGLVVNSGSRADCQAALDRLIGDDPLRTRLQRQAMWDVCEFFPERGAYATLEAVFNGQQSAACASARVKPTRACEPATA